VTHDIPEAILIGNRIMMMSPAGVVMNIRQSADYTVPDLEELLREELRHSHVRPAGAEAAPAHLAKNTSWLRMRRRPHTADPVQGAGR
jgi:ABC-type nitrate/sulfonate/bicarbonate transport system ATPase subunit